jgi:hypothetical protein
MDVSVTFQQALRVGSQNLVYIFRGELRVFLRQAANAVDPRGKFGFFASDTGPT